MAVIVDSCVLLDVFNQDPKWYEWSAEALANAADSGALIINPIIYAEISIQFVRIETLELLLPQEVFEFRPVPREAAFLAGKCFLKYRRLGGTKSLPLPDFFIGAHASILNVPVLTRDTLKFSKFFPTLHLIHP